MARIEAKVNLLNKKVTEGNAEILKCVQVSNKGEGELLKSSARNCKTFEIPCLISVDFNVVLIQASLQERNEAQIPQESHYYFYRTVGKKS